MDSRTTQPPGIDKLISEMAFILFRHKWKIIIFTLAGVAAAACVWVMTPTVYRSEARLLVRYVADTTVDDPAAGGSKIVSPDSRGANIMNSEIAILTSMELLGEVVDAIGPEELLASDGIGASRENALLALSQGLQTEVPKNSSVIRVYCDSARPNIARDALARLIRLYLEKHIDIHRSGLAYDFLSQQTDQVGARLAETEAELRAAKAEVGVADIEQSKSLVEARIAVLVSQVQDAETELAGSVARFEAMIKALPHASGASGNVNAVSAAMNSEEKTKQAYLFDRIARLREREAILLLTYTEDSLPVRSIRREMARTEGEWKTLRSDVGVALLPTSHGPTNSAMPVALLDDELLDEQANIAALQAKLDVVQRYLDEAEKEASRIEQSEGRIRHLERKKEIEEVNYLYFSKSLEQSRVDDALDAGKISNISVVQSASYPLHGMRPDLLRNIGIALAIGLFAGLGLAFVTEKGVNTHWFTRPSELTETLGIPILVTIPQVVEKARGKRGKVAAAMTAFQTGEAQSSAWTTPNQFTSYCETLQQKLMANPDLHPGKTPLLGVTCCSSGAGVSTIASGIAVSLARGEDVRVLLVSATLDHGAEVFLTEDKQVTVVDRNRYIVTGDVGETTLPEIASPVRKFRQFAAQAKESDCGFIVVDLPPISETGLAAPIGSASHNTSPIVGDSRRSLKVLVALLWASRSTSSTRRPIMASPAARFRAVVVLPTPPF